jgi:hypothetical protein
MFDGWWVTFDSDFGCKYFERRINPVKKEDLKKQIRSIIDNLKQPDEEYIKKVESILSGEVLNKEKKSNKNK